MQNIYKTDRQVAMRTDVSLSLCLAAAETSFGSWPLAWQAEKVIPQISITPVNVTHVYGVMFVANTSHYENCAFRDSIGCKCWAFASHLLCFQIKSFRWGKSRWYLPYLCFFVSALYKPQTFQLKINVWLWASPRPCTPRSHHCQVSS